MFYEWNDNLSVGSNPLVKTRPPANSFRFSAVENHSVDFVRSAEENRAGG